ncbi:MAG: SDR family oxidoreductase [Chloroflexi bacterium]|nr:SDR family oxidoreductase [Chloroflexota bacterium]
MDERFLVTGALGCIGAWTVRHLVREGVPVVALDQATDARRLRLIATAEEVAAVRFVQGDITSLDSVEAVLDEHRITHVAHLAALQVPFCRANPPLGALVNVVGTVNVFEAVRRRSDRIWGLAYMSSIGMFDAGDGDPIDGTLRVDAAAHPRTLYGVTKLANEGTARVYWLENGVASVGLRPLTVYGPARDQGLTSGPTRAIGAALLGRSFEIGFGGATLFQFAPDVAAAVVAAARSASGGAEVYNLGGTPASIDDFIATVESEVPEARGRITHTGPGLPFPDRIDDAGSEALGERTWTPLRDGVRRTAALFRERLARGELRPVDVGLE